MAEIPLVYPNHADQPWRYLVDESSRRLVPNDAPQVSGLDDTGSASMPIFEETLSGSASVSELDLNGRSFLLTTSAKMEKPDVLCVALSTSTTGSGGDFTSPVLLELDYSQLDLRPLVAVQAFVQDGSWISLVVVDSQGTFISIPLTRQLLPLSEEPSSVLILKITDYIENLAVLQEVAGSELQPTMVVFSSATKAIVALSPIIMTVDLSKAASHIWSETQCLEDMRARGSSFGGILNNVSDLILGKLDSGVVDMPPTAALCLTTSSNPLLDATYCITLHSDASVRKWKVDLDQAALPIDVSTLNATGLPTPSTWSDRRNAVSLCGRIYDQTYAICVHIKTQGFLNPTTQAESDPEALSTNSDCHLWVLHGNSREIESSQGTSISLKVPSDAVGLVGMAFSPTASRCSLSVLFESMDAEHDRSTTTHLIYPPSIMSIVSPEPVAVGHGNLDIVASKERSRIRSLLMGPTLLKSMEESTLDEILHELDSIYLKYLFRPMFPRGTGSILPPAAGCIRRALAKLVHNSTKKTELGMSIELETVRTLYEWKHRDDRKLAIAMTPSKKTPRRAARQTETIPADGATPFTLYDAFIQDENNDDEGAEDDVDMDEVTKMWEKDEHERANAVEAHERRWRRLLLQVWEEEHVFRLPLLVKWLQSQPVQIMIRAGVTTAISDRPPAHEDVTGGPWSSALDRIALKLMSYIEDNRDKSTRLYTIEQQLSTMISKAQMACEPMDKGLNNELSDLAKWAWEEGLRAQDISDDEQDQLEDTVSGLSPSELVQWIQATPKNSSGSLPGLEIIESDEGLTGTESAAWGDRQVASYQLRHSACALSTRCVDSARRLQLSRYLLLLSNVVPGSHARDAALRAYLYAITTLWISSQRVPMPLTAFQSRKPPTVDGPSPRASPPNKRLSFGDDATSALSPIESKLTTPMDAVIIDASQRMHEASSLPVSPVGVVIGLTRLYFRQAFSSRGDIPIGQPSLLPELGSLPRPKNPTIATDHPRLALRLLAPYVACAIPEDSADVLLARKESLAECLLIESHSVSSMKTNKMEMRRIACELLVPKIKDPEVDVQHKLISTAFRVLESIVAEVGEKNVSFDDLSKLLQTLVPSGTSIEVRRLCEMETVRRLYSPLVVGAGESMGDVEKVSVARLANSMLHLSRVIYRLSILERHANDRSGDTTAETPDYLMGFISRAIGEMAEVFTDEVCQTMPEYGKLWSRLFNHALVTGQWTTAYSACVRNPAPETRHESFPRLVRAMVDQGALSDLLSLCTELGIRVGQVSSLSEQEANETVDLYEIASEILADAVPLDPYSMRATSLEPAGLADYQGALYALHASKRNWRRAAQSMDFRFLTAKEALKNSSKRYALNPQSAGLQDGLIIEDLVLASVGALNAIELTKEKAHQFLISGEFGPHNRIAVDSNEEESTDGSKTGRNKRSMDPSSNHSRVESEEVDRLSCFMASVQLEGRAIRSIGLRSLFFDRATNDQAGAKSAFLREMDSAGLDIDAMFEQGYYQEGLLLARCLANCQKAETGSSSPEGIDLFYDYLRHLVAGYLVPLSSKESHGLVRPSLNQLAGSLSDLFNPEKDNPYITAQRSGKLASLKGAALGNGVMMFIQKLVGTFSSPAMPLAVNTAECFLEHVGSMPSWLERTMLALDKESSAGLFAPRRNDTSTKYLGDPNALLSLYIKRGMLSEACNIVSMVLSAVDATGESSHAKVASRLPEKGDVDYVPYSSIDLLGGIIDAVLARQTLTTTERSHLVAARSRLEESLKKHFALLQISEMGLRSARALR